MSFTCHNGPTHQHNLAYEARVCYGLITPPAMPRPYEVHEPGITSRQLSYIGDLGGNTEAASRMTKKQAHEYINRLLGGKVEPATTTAPSRPVDPRLTMLTGLFDKVRDGYYATKVDANAPTRFLRLSTPKPGRTAISKASRKVQTQHGDRLEVAAALWPSGNWSVYDSRVVEQLMLVVADARGCLRRYAQEIGKCCRCNASLTDERSRHYGIGPECEKHWPDLLNEVDEENDGLTYEQLLARR